MPGSSHLRSASDVAAAGHHGPCNSRGIDARNRGLRRLSREPDCIETGPAGLHAAVARAFLEAEMNFGRYDHHVVFDALDTVNVLRRDLIGFPGVGAVDTAPEMNDAVLGHDIGRA